MANTYHKRGEKIDGYNPKNHPNYMTWAGMKSRCRNSNKPHFKNYGGRGIDYCDDWKHFKNFCRDMGIRPSTKHSIDRIDNNKGYYPENCRWATNSEQSLNRRMFSNNTSGFVGVELRKKSGRYIAEYQEGNKRYRIGGTFSTSEEAVAARNKLLVLLTKGKNVSHMLERPARFDSSTSIRGISKHQKGGYIVRRTTKDRKRVYIGFFMNFKKAQQELEKWKAEQN